MGFGSLLGSLAGSIGQKFLPIPGVDGGQLGGAIGSLLPFKTGGAVKKTGPALLHKGEFVLSANAKPTKAQRAIVAANKRKAKAKVMVKPKPRKTKKSKSKTPSGKIPSGK